MKWFANTPFPQKLRYKICVKHVLSCEFNILERNDTILWETRACNMSRSSKRISWFSYPWKWRFWPMPRQVMFKSVGRKKIWMKYCKNFYQSWVDLQTDKLAQWLTLRPLPIVVWVWITGSAHEFMDRLVGFLWALHIYLILRSHWCQQKNFDKLL